MSARVRRYVVGLDKSGLGWLAVDEAVAAAVEQSGEVHVVYAHQTLGEATNLYAGPGDPAMEFEVERLAPLLRERLAKWGSDAPNLVLHGVVGGAAAALVATAAVLGADAIYVGTHGRTGVARAFLGSVAEKVARTAGCHVIVVREQAHDLELRWPIHHRQLAIR